MSARGLLFQWPVCTLLHTHTFFFSFSKSWHLSTGHKAMTDTNDATSLVFVFFSALSPGPCSQKTLALAPYDHGADQCCLFSIRNLRYTSCLPKWCVMHGDIDHALSPQAYPCWRWKLQHWSGYRRWRDLGPNVRSHLTKGNPVRLNGCSHLLPANKWAIFQLEARNALTLSNLSFGHVFKLGVYEVVEVFELECCLFLNLWGYWWLDEDIL